MRSRSLRRDLLVGVAAAVVAISVAVVGGEAQRTNSWMPHSTFLEWISVVALVISGIFAVSRLADGLGQLMVRRSLPGAGAVVRLVSTGVGYLIVIFAVFGVLGVSLQHLLIGAGLAGVVLGIAAQQSLGNIFASLVLLFARPFSVGDHIRIRSGVVGVLDVDVLGIGLTYVTVRTEDGVLKVPNSIVLASGIGQLGGSRDSMGDAVDVPGRPDDSDA